MCAYMYVLHTPLLVCTYVVCTSTHQPKRTQTYCALEPIVHVLIASDAEHSSAALHSNHN
ncbi:uncharacterized protein BDW43DRAFT_261782 [Aspergillus alliaceus]|uniref:uncharacterized protein n=1 Tax=Petromyces alliaceus TaxID=209559 RepID=UPI0012A75CD9|nr:uncharacterized protein BDW43DRAFT_261782 [Aspergillus alliaceus]KAB8238485.1 hypothetical protein BDW43DRAFT_261782 [Aspergillus alliaceus]